MLKAVFWLWVACGRLLYRLDVMNMWIYGMRLVLGKVGGFYLLFRPVLNRFYTQRITPTTGLLVQFYTLSTALITRTTTLNNLITIGA